MAAADFERCLANVLVSEGGFSNDLHDPGGATMNGITQAEYNAWRKKNGLARRSVRYLTPDERRTIYKEEYWDRIKGDDLPPGLDYCVFDEAVNSGVGRALATLRHMPADIALEDEIDAFNDLRLEFLRGLYTYRYFGKGWEYRVEKVSTIAHLMATAAPKSATPLPAAA
jgi:lysozyme family protein